MPVLTRCALAPPCVALMRVLRRAVALSCALAYFAQLAVVHLPTPPPWLGGGPRLHRDLCGHLVERRVIGLALLILRLARTGPLTVHLRCAPGPLRDGE